MRRGIGVLMVLSPLYSLLVAGIGFSASPGPSAMAGGVPSGIVAGLAGEAGARPAAGIPRPLRVGERVGLGEEIRTEASGTAEILWDRRALVVLGERSRMKVVESNTGTVDVDVAEGTVRVSYSYNEGRPTDILTILTPASRTVLRGGIVEAVVLAPPASGAPGPRRTRGSASTDARSGERLRVIEGQAQVEGRIAGGKSVVVKAGQEFHSGARTAEAVRPTASVNQPRLAAVPHHDAVPDPTIQHLVQVHVAHALEIERALQAPSREETEIEASAATKGTIVATSLGIPLPTLAQSTSAPSPSAPVPAPSGPIPAPIVGGGGQPGSVGVGQAGPGSSGPTLVVSPPVPAAAPVVPVPTVQPPSPPAVTPTQSGGINTRSLLRQVLRDAVKNKAQRRGKERERD